MDLGTWMNEGNTEAIAHVVDLLRQSKFEDARSLLEPYRALAVPVIYRWGAEDMTLDDLLDMPCFQVGNTRAPDAGQQVETHMSADVSSTARQVLRNAYSFNVRFEAWESLPRELATVEITVAPTANFRLHAQNLLNATRLSEVAAMTMTTTKTKREK